MGKENPVFFDDQFYRFVILHHTGHRIEVDANGRALGRGDHWDWMFDWPAERFGGADGFLKGGAADGLGPLLTFCSELSPADWTCGTVFEALPLHRRRYLEYEGPLSGDRGRVKRVVSGRLRWLQMASCELAWTVESIDFPGQPFRDWIGASYCLKQEGQGVGCEDSAAEDPAPGRELPEWLASDAQAAVESPGSQKARWILRRLPGNAF